MTRTRWTRALALLFAFGLAAAACGGDETGFAPAIVEDASTDDAGSDAAPSDADAPTDADAAEPSAVEEEDDEPADLGQVVVADAADCTADAPPLEPGTFDPSGDFVYAISLPANSLNPHDDQTPATFAYYGWIYEGLVRQNADGSVVPWLARCWETNDDRHGGHLLPARGRHLPRRHAVQRRRRGRERGVRQDRGPAAGDPASRRPARHREDRRGSGRAHGEVHPERSRRDPAAERADPQLRPDGVTGVAGRRRRLSHRHRPVRGGPSRAPT